MRGFTPSAVPWSIGVSARENLGNSLQGKEIRFLFAAFFIDKLGKIVLFAKTGIFGTKWFNGTRGFQVSLA
jgi:hypothetical protein